MPTSSGMSALDTGCAQVGLSTQRHRVGILRRGAVYPLKSLPSNNTLQMLHSLIDSHCLKMPLCWSCLMFWALWARSWWIWPAPSLTSISRICLKVTVSEHVRPGRKLSILWSKENFLNEETRPREVKWLAKLVTGSVSFRNSCVDSRLILGPQCPGMKGILSLGEILVLPLRFSSPPLSAPPCNAPSHFQPLKEYHWL